MSDRERADDAARRAGIARQVATAFAAAAGSPQRLARALIELEPLGYTLLSERRAPGGARGHLAHLLVGPSGVLLVDVAPWRDVTIAGGRVWRGADDATAEIERLADLLHRTQGELAEIGLPPGEVRAVVAFAGLEVPRTELFGLTLLGDADAVLKIAGLPPRLPPTRVAEVRVALEALFPPHTTGPVTIAHPRDPAPAFEPGTLPTATAIEEALRTAAAERPVEEWMSFLDPDQARLVRRSFSGPARIRGAAGTGKTVVALHRAVHLARVTGGPVLVTALSSNLPAVLRGFARRLAPDVVDRIDFRSVSAFATEVLAARGVRLPVDAEAASRIFDAVWRSRGLEGPLGALDPAARYWYEEVLEVIKGRGLTRFEQYAGLARHGRRRPLDPRQRAAVWELYVAYESGLRAVEVVDEQDVVLEAEAALRREPIDRYRAVIVDEAQDLSCVAIRLLHSLVGDLPDGLTLVGDGQQTLSASGATLAEAGVSIDGRSARLTTNHRSTVEITEFAHLLVRGDEHTDLEGALTVADTADTRRHGPRPVHTVFPSRAVHDRSLVERVRRIVAERADSGAAPRLGDVGVLALHSWHAEEAAAALEAAGIPTIDLADDVGAEIDAVRVGTIRRAKGRDFAEVLVVRTPPYLVQAMPPTLDDAARERTIRQRRELFVALTRARDGLWIGVA